MFFSSFSLAPSSAIGRLHFQPDQLADNVHTLLASVADIAQGGNGNVNAVPPRVKRRECPWMWIWMRRDRAQGH